MTTLTITMGLPASGKSTWARQEAARTGAVLVSRDDLRAMLHPGEWPHGDLMWEAWCTVAHHGAIKALLRDGANVIAHDTNLSLDYRRALETAARLADADFVVKDFTDVPLEECITRDAARWPHRVGEKVIRAMWERHLAPEAVSDRG